MFIEQPPQFIRLLYPKLSGVWIKKEEPSTSLLMTAPYLR